MRGIEEDGGGGLSERVDFSPLAFLWPAAGGGAGGGWIGPGWGAALGVQSGCKRYASGLPIARGRARRGFVWRLAAWLASRAANWK